MLVIQRKEGESIIIGDDIEVKIFGMKYYYPDESKKLNRPIFGRIKKKDSVTYIIVGVKAPKEVQILREEIAEEQKHIHKLKHGESSC